MTDTFHGDHELADELARRLGVPVAAAAVATAEGATTAAVGTDLDADFEIGSITKAVTGLLYADALARGEITRETTLGDLLRLPNPRMTRIPLAALATHRSGLPNLPPAARPWRSLFAMVRHGANPYGEDRGQVLAQADGVRLRLKVTRYSNFGFELLGHALAAAAGTDYRRLLSERLSEPLGLDPWYIAAEPNELRPGAIVGASVRGRRRDPWTGAGVGPAGGIRASIDAMGRFTTALLDGSAPGLAALDPVASFGLDYRIGAAWLTMRAKGRTIVWHNGATGGCRSWIGLDREAGVGVAVLSATARMVDRHGMSMLRERL